MASTKHYHLSLSGQRVVVLSNTIEYIILKLKLSMNATPMPFVSILMVVMTVFVELEHLVMVGTFVSPNIVPMDGTVPIQPFVSKFQKMLNVLRYRMNLI